MRVQSSLRAGRRGRLRASESVAGWIFADMLLVLFIVGLGTAIPVEPPKPEPKPEPKPTPEIVGMKTQSVNVAFSVNAARLVAGDPQATVQARRSVDRVTVKLRKQGAKAAMVLIFGGGETAGMGQQVAAKVYPQLNKAAPTVFSPGTANRDFWDGSLPYGRVRLEVFVFTTEKKAK